MTALSDFIDGMVRDAMLAQAARESTLIEQMLYSSDLMSVQATGMTVADAQAHRALCDRIRFGRDDAIDDYRPDYDSFSCGDCGRDTGPEVGPCPTHQPAAHYWDTHPDAHQGPAHIPPATRETVIFPRAGTEPTA